MSRYLCSSNVNEQHTGIVTIPERQFQLDSTYSERVVLIIQRIPIMDMRISAIHDTVVEVTLAMKEIVTTSFESYATFSQARYPSFMRICASNASDYVTGHTLVVDGERTAHN